MLKLIPISIILTLFIGACSVNYNEEITSSCYEVAQVYPPVYYGTEDFPESAFYVVLINKKTQEYTEKLFVDQRCKKRYKRVDVGKTYMFSQKTTTNIIGQKNTQLINLKKVLCENNFEII